MCRTSKDFRKKFDPKRDPKREIKELVGNNLGEFLPGKPRPRQSKAEKRTIKSGFGVTEEDVEKELFQQPNRERSF